MKNLILTVFFFFYTFSSFAQEVLDMSILPEAAYTYIVRNDTASTYAITPASTSPQTWDFSSLLNHYEKVPTYDSTSKSPYQAEFPSSNLYTYGPSVLYSGLFGGAPVDGQPSNGYMFWRNEPTGFWSIGFLSETGTFAGQPIHFDSDELIIPLPGILNSTINNNSRWTIPMDFNPADADTFYVSNTTKTFNFDSYGSIKTPVLDLPEVLRLHENHLKIDSVYVKVSGMTVFEMELSRVESNQYYYLTNDYSYPVLTTYADDQNNILFTEYYSTQVVNTTMDLATLTKKDDIKIYPNPFTDEVYIEINESAIVSVFSTTGKLVKKERINSIENRIDLYNLLPGMYFISIQADKGQNLFIEKVIKTR